MGKIPIAIALLLPIAIIFGCDGLRRSAMNCTNNLMYCDTHLVESKPPNSTQVLYDVNAIAIGIAYAREHSAMRRAQSAPSQD